MKTKYNKMEETKENDFEKTLVSELAKQLEPNPVGRPTVMTPEVIAKLEEAFLNGANDKEAIFLANISKDAFYDYCKNNPEFSERIEGLRDMPKYTAKKNVVRKIVDGDVAQSNWYLERKVKEEFSSRNEHTGGNGEKLVFNLVAYNENNHNPVQVPAEEIPNSTTESTG